MALLRRSRICMPSCHCDLRPVAACRNQLKLAQAPLCLACKYCGSQARDARQPAKQPKARQAKPSQTESGIRIVLQNPLKVLIHRKSAANIIIIIIIVFIFILSLECAPLSDSANGEPLERKAHSSCHLGKDGALLSCSKRTKSEQPTTRSQQTTDSCATNKGSARVLGQNAAPASGEEINNLSRSLNTKSSKFCVLSRSRNNYPALAIAG